MLPSPIHRRFGIRLMSVDAYTLVAILAMALATYATRTLGYAALRRVQPTGRLKAALEAVPGAILLSIIAPGLVQGGPAEWAAAAVTVALAVRLPIIVAVIGGVGTVVALRALLGH